MKNKYRIAEYRNHFRIERQYTEYLNCLFYTKEILEWSTIKKDGNVLLVRDWMSKDLFQFATKEEALQAIADLEKYPIYHFVN